MDAKPSDLHPFRFTFACHGARIGVRSDVPELGPWLTERFPPGWSATSAPVDRWFSVQMDRAGGESVLRAGSRVVARYTDPSLLLDDLESRIHFTVALRARDRLFVHAGVVGYRGRAVLLPGRTMTGKTTLVEALVRAGATYYSDEYAVLDAAGRVHPYPKALSIRESGRDRPLRLRTDRLAQPSGSEPWPVGLVVASRFRPEARLALRPATRAEGLLLLLANTVQARLRPQETLRVLGAAVRECEVLQGERGAAHEAARALLDFLERGQSPMTREEILHHTFYLPTNLGDGPTLRGGFHESSQQERRSPHP
jgi:hypothetical protein